MRKTLFTKTLFSLALACLATPALAHSGGDVHVGFTAGFLHPLTGLDHLVAMVAVGLWGAQLGKPEIWLLPIAFPLVMAFGGLLGIMGIALPLSEPLIAASAIVLGLVVVTQARWPMAAAIALVSVFAIFHGYAHGRELPDAASPEAYAIGFVMATGMLHGVGILIGTLQRLRWGSYVVRGLGFGISAIGVVFLYGQMIAPA